MNPIKERVQELVTDTIGPLLVERAMVLHAKLTDEEKAEREDQQFRLPKKLILALDVGELLDREIGAEAITKEVRALRRIRLKRPG